MNCRMQFSISGKKKNSHWDFGRDCMNLQIILSSIDLNNIKSASL